MPVKVTQGTNPLGYLGRREEDWRLRSVHAQDGLNPTRVDRYFEAPDGIDFAEGTAQPFKLDATANADDGTNAANVTVDAHRYVVNPHVLKHQFAGLWTGGPVRWGTDAQTQHRTIEQSLTRTWPAGHGYMVDAAGNYVVVWKDAAGDGFHRDGPNGTTIAVAAADVCEYATAKQALLDHRPSLVSRFSPYLAFREDIPGSYWREVVWRDFTHESIPFIEALKDSPSDVRAVAEAHFGSRVAGDVEDLTANVDKDTNTVYVKCTLRLRDLAEPADADVETPEKAVAWLLSLPRVEAPCTRDTLRMFGLDQFGEGEGYLFTHAYLWPGLKDSANTRKALEFVNDGALLPFLRAADYTADAPTKLASADGTYRFYTSETLVPAAGQTPAVTCDVPWWRIRQQKLDKDSTEDGALAFNVVIERPEWHGSGVASRAVHVSTGSPAGYGATETRTIVSLPEDAAEAAMQALSAPERRVLSAVSHEGGEKGARDVVYSTRRLYAYHDAGQGEEPIPAGDREPAGTQEVEGFAYPHVEVSASATDETRKAASVTLPRVAPADVPAAIAAAKAAFADNDLVARRVRAVLDGDGAYTLTLDTNGYQTADPQVAHGATFTEETGAITEKEIEKTYRRPSGAGADPAEGYWWRVNTYTYKMGRTSGGAVDAATHVVNGKPGTRIWPERQNDPDSIGSVWAWKVVTAISFGTWSAGALSV